MLNVPGVEDLYWYKAKLLSVYDGDTIRVDIDLGLNLWLRNQSIRLYGINTPELRGEEREEGLRAREYLSSLLDGRSIMLRTYKDKTGKYGRFLAEVWFFDEVNDCWGSANEWLIKGGYANRYMG